jgi:hypothetical protein
MERRSFMKKSVSVGILTPLAFSGLINSAGAVEGGTDTTWYTTDSTTSTETTWTTTEVPPLYDPEAELGLPNYRPSDCDGNCTLSAWYKDQVQGTGMCCWREVNGCDVAGQPGKTYSWLEKCPSDPNDRDFDIAMHTWCISLQNKTLPPPCPQCSVLA